MTFLTREEILEADDREYDTVEVDEWKRGGKVRIRSITTGERTTYEQSCIVQKGSDRQLNLRRAREKLLVLMICDEEGNRIFAEDDIRALGKKNAKPIDRIFDKCQKLAGLSKEDIDQLTENFEETQEEDSSSD